MPAPAHRNTTTYHSSSSATSHSVSIPSGTAAKDMLVLNVTSFNAVPDDISGWTTVSKGNVSGSTYYGHFTRPADGTEGSSVSVTFASASQVVAVISSYKNTNRVDVTATSSVQSSSTPAASAVTTTQDDELVILLSGGGVDDTTLGVVAPPTGYTERGEDYVLGYGIRAETCDIVQATHGSSGTPTQTLSSTFRSWIITTISIKPLVYFGNTGSGAATRTILANQDGAEMFQCSADGKITNAEAFLRGNGVGNANARFIVYNGPQVANGDPSFYSIVGYSDTVVITTSQAAGWVDIPFSTPPNVVNGTWYALGLQGDADLKIDTSGSGAWYNGADTFSDGPASTYPQLGSESGSTRQISVRAGVWISPVTNATATLTASVTTSATVARSCVKVLTPIATIVPTIVKALSGRVLSATAHIVPLVGRLKNVVLPNALVTAVAALSRVLIKTKLISATITPTASIAHTGTPPVPVDFSVTGYSAIVEFDSDLTTNDPTESKFAFTIDGSSVTITLAQPTGRLLYLYFTGPAANNKAAHLVYTPGSGGVKLTGANAFLVAGFTLDTTTVVVDDSVPSLTTHGGFNDLTH